MVARITASINLLEREIIFTSNLHVYKKFACLQLNYMFTSNSHVYK